MAQTNNTAIVMDLDLTLTEAFCEVPIFEKYGYDEAKFWAKVRAEQDKRVRNLEQQLEASRQRTQFKGLFSADSKVGIETVYSDVLIDLIQNGEFKGLTVEKLEKLGKEIKFHPGVPEFMPELRKYMRSEKNWAKHNIDVEFYIISCGVGPIIRGSKIAPHLADIFAFEFEENENGICKATNTISYAEKPKYLYKINKGPEFDENDKVPEESRRIDKRNIIYLGDGQSDTQAFRTISTMAGDGIKPINTLAIYRNKNGSFAEATKLFEAGRVYNIGPADYNPQSHTMNLLREMLKTIANRTVSEIEEKIRRGVIGRPQI
jgi:2-hydroxy-3-keto-5-methylthiopentenyl-1-phosphate phosphatase